MNSTEVDEMKLFTPSIREYVIDLELPEDRRWQHVVEREAKTASKLFDEAMKDFSGFDTRPAVVVKKLFKSAYRLFGGRYVAEMEAWAEAVDRRVEDVLLLNCSYELTQAWDYGVFINPLACTAGIHNAQGLGMFHVRTMDWPLKQLGKATRIFRFREGTREFVTVGATGMIGVLSGMLPGAYSVTINYAPPSKRSRFAFGPLFLLREVLETCDSYKDAVEALSNTKLASNVFFTVCGAEKNQGCIIERTVSDAAIRRYRGSPLCQGNHFAVKRMETHNAPYEVEDEDFSSMCEDSLDRSTSLAASLGEVQPGSSLLKAATVLDYYPVSNEDTHQMMCFCPSTGEFHAWSD